MDDDPIVAVYVVIDETMAALGYRSHPLAVVSNAEESLPTPMPG